MTKPGHAEPLLDNQGEPNLFSTRPIPEQPTAPSLHEQLDSQIPAAARRMVEATKTEDDDEWDRLDRSGYPRTTQQTREDVGRTMLKAEDIERAEKTKIKKNYKPPQRHKPRRPGFGIPADTANNDKKVEATYGKPGEIL